MRTRSSSNLVGESSPNPTTLNLKRRNRRRSKQPFSLEESPLDTMADQRTMTELLCAPTEGYAEAIVVPPILAEHFELKHSLINMMTSDQFFRLEKDNPHDHIPIAITFDLSTMETEDSLSMGDEHHDTIPETESNEFVKSSVENLVPNPSEFEDLSDSECDVPTCDDFTTFFDLLFDADDDFSSSDDKLFSDEDILKEIYLNPMLDEEIISIKIDPHHFNAESDLIESLLNHDSSIISSSSKIDYFLDEFVGELILLKTIPPGIDKADCDTEEEIRLIEKLLYDNSSPRILRTRKSEPFARTGLSECRCGWDNVSKTDDRIDKLADEISNLVEIVNKQVVAPAKAIEKICVTCGGAHAYYECIATDIQNNPNRFNQWQGNFFNQANNFNQGNNFGGNNFQNNHGYRAQMNNVSNFQNQGFQNQPFSVPNNQIPPSVPNEFSSYMKPNEIMIKSMQNQINVLRCDFSKQEEKLRRNLNDDMRSILESFFQNQPSTSGTLLSNTIPNPKGDMKAVTTRSSLAYEGPSIPTESPLEKVDEQNTEEILDKEQSNSSGSTAQVQPLVAPISIPEPNVSRTKTKPTIPYPSSFVDALLLMPKFALTIKSLLANKDKLFELTKVSLNENCSAMLLKKLLEKLRDPGKFFIPCDFPGMEVCHALTNLGASINLMPLSIWKKLSLPELTPTRMTLELADRSITRPKRVYEDVFVKVGKFHSLTDFVVVEFEADLRVPLILGRSFLRTGHAIIDVYGEEITLNVNDESITFNLNQTMRYSLTYDDTSVNRVDVIDVACEEFVQDVLDFQYNPKSSIPTLVSDDSISEKDSSKVPIVKSSSATLTSFGENPFQIPLMDIKLVEESKEKSSVKEPPELELKELPSHLDKGAVGEIRSWRESLVWCTVWVVGDWGNRRTSPWCFESCQPDLGLRVWRVCSFGPWVFSKV
nr:hypothetical protein [Tanacetum cinerariifolium]